MSFKIFALVAALGVPTIVAFATETGSKRIDAIRRSIATMTPQTHVDKVDHERIAVRRLDIIDEQGTIRMSLGAPTPAPIIDGIQYKRAFPVSGLVYYDKQGSGRGGLGVADVPGVLWSWLPDHENVDAIGWKVMPDAREADASCSR